MRFGVGLAILGVGVVGIGWLARAEFATHMQEMVGLQAQTVAAGSVHGVAATVAGRDITVAGLADGPGEHDQLIAAFTSIRGRRTVVDALQILPVADPFDLNAQWQGQTLNVTGHVPTQPGQAMLAELGANGLTLAAGAPDANWSTAAHHGLSALRMLESGQLSFVGQRMSVMGVAQTPDDGEAIRAMLDGLPAGYQADLGLDYVDDGSPAAYTLHYAADTGAWVDGKLPRGLAASDLAAALGLTSVNDEAATQALMGDQGVVPAGVSALASWMGDVEAVNVAVTPEGVDVTAGFGAGADLDLVGAALEADLSGQVSSVDVARVEANEAEGAQRMNTATGRAEELRGGFWLPVAAFEPGLQVCAEQAEAVLASNGIGFVTGSARLNARARGAINALASVMGACLRGTGLQAELGGHTDSTGSAEGNLTLSRERAEAVRAALIARGVPEDALSAEGYGATQPIAENDTEDGRRANRRTAVRWTE